MQQQKYKAVGEALEAARKRRGLTQHELARKLRKPQSFVSAYENGQRRVDVLELIRIAEEMRVDPVKLFADVLVRNRVRK